MAGDPARALALPDEHPDIAFETQRPRALEAIGRDRKRTGELVGELGRLGTDVGPRPADLQPEPD